jgi:hypothetical protein
MQREICTVDVLLTNMRLRCIFVLVGDCNAAIGINITGIENKVRNDIIKLPDG